MNFTTLDWSIVAVLLGLLLVAVLYSNRHTKSVADYLAGGRSGGRYMMTMGSGMVWIGAINIVAMFQLYHGAGLVAMWMVMLSTPFILVLNISGFGVYRFRETRALTVAQFLETRYGKDVRIFSAILAWSAGLINFGLFPAIGARFFVNFCGLPDSFQWIGITWQTFPLTMIGLLTVSLFFVFYGGHVAVLVTDCLQGMFTQIAALVIIVVLGWMWFDWDAIGNILLTVPEEGKSLVNPFKAGDVKDFNTWYFLIGIVGAWYAVMSNLQSQAYVASARSGHEFRMGNALNQWRWLGLCLFFIVLVLCAMNVMHNPEYADQSAAINARLDAISPDPANATRSELTITVALTHIMPVGLAGLLCAIMLAALISTYDSFMHTWGAVFLQDVVMPFRKRPFAKGTHLTALRLSIIGVAVFAFFYSLFLENQESILMYFALVNNLWLGGAGAVILGGLYWKRGSRRGAIAALVVSLLLGATGYIVTQWWPKWYGVDFPVNPQWLFLISIVVSSVVYVVGSVLEGHEHDMEKLLHRGKHAIPGDHGEDHGAVSRLQRCFGITPEFTRGDRRITYWIFGWFLLWLGVFLVGTVYAWLAKPSDESWLAFWKIYLWCLFALTIVTTVWFTLGGIRDLKRFYHDLKHQTRDDADDGFVPGGNPAKDSEPS